MSEDKKVILIVEDDPVLADMYSTKLNSAGYDIIIGKDGAAGLSLAITQKPDLILLDVLLPKFSGIELLKKLRQNPNSKSVPVIVLTNVAEKEEREEATKLGAKAYMIKAMHPPGSIVSKVKELLAGT